VTRIAETLLPARLGHSFRWLLASSWTTNLGDGIAVAAGPLLVASLTSDPFLVSLAALLGWAPPLVFGLTAGVLADRLDRRVVVMIADGFRAVVLVLLVVAIAGGSIRIGLALAAIGLLTTAEVFADTTSSTLLPMLVHRDDLALANARLQTGFVTFNQLVGPSIGAALFAAGRAWPFCTQAVLVAFGVLLVSRVSLPPHRRDSERAGSVRHDVAEGIRWTIRHPAVRTLALTILVFNVTFGAAWSVLVLYTRDRLGLGAVGYGLVTTISAAGGLLGTAAYGWITRRVSLADIMRVGLVIETLTHLGLALTRSPWVAAVIFFVFGMHAFVWGATSTTVRQRAVPTELQGRVGSVYMIAVYAGLVVGSAVGGALASRFGLTAPFWFGFAGSAVFLVLLWGELARIAHGNEPEHESATNADRTHDS
jgi:predicted MFS family arabinose efflux permease